MRGAALIALAGSGCVTALTVTTAGTVTDASIAPAFALPTQDGATLSLAGALEHGAVVLIFYRGYW